MIELAQKIAYTSIGLVAFTLEKMQETIDDLVYSDKISAEEGEKIIHELMRDAGSIKEEVEYQLRSNVEKLFHQFTAQKEDRLEDLKKRLEYLESTKLGK